MKIESIALQGFQGFNDRCSIQIHPRLTVIYAANSYGKTSICEGLQWLLYGKTSRTEQAESKSEYKGSYRNVHTLGDVLTFVEAVFIQSGSKFTFRCEMNEDETTLRFANGKEINEWPIIGDIHKLPRPFVLQHALKDLLLVKPDQRFQGFARLLGFEDLDAILHNIVSVCTKPEARVPPDVEKFVKKVELLENRLMGQPSLAAVQRAYKKGRPQLAKTYEIILQECKKRVAPDTPESGILPQLLKIREEAVGKVFQHRVTLSRFSDEEHKHFSQEEASLLGLVTEDLIKNYTALIGLSTFQHISDQIQLFELGLKLRDKTNPICPLCGQEMTSEILDHVDRQHSHLQEQKSGIGSLEEQRRSIESLLSAIRSKLNDFQARHLDKNLPLIKIKPSLGQLDSILLPKHATHLTSIKQAIFSLEEKGMTLTQAHKKALGALKEVEVSITDSRENAKWLKDLGEALSRYVAEARSYVEVVQTHAQSISDADQILRHELDAIAGTQDVSILIELLERKQDIEKKFEIQLILEELKDLRKHVEQYVGQKMLQAVAGELSSEVMEWYKQIRTTGDPDVHFDGFDMERTQSGEVKSRRIQVKAKSYGKDLVSAVASLSESKLNALGICICIASNMRAETPFEFLVIDDPIQSLDAEHEAQCVEVIRKLVEKDKQVVLLSHNSRWVEQVRSGCRSISGTYYEITFYNQAGPHIREVTWEGWKQRLSEIDAILKDASANSVRIQQAEEEIRTVVSQVTSEIYQKVKGIPKDASKLNSGIARKALIESGVPSGLVDKVMQSFATTDDAHHAPSDYSANRQRIQRYYDSTWELVRFMQELH